MTNHLSFSGLFISEDQAAEPFTELEMIALHRLRNQLLEHNQEFQGMTLAAQMILLADLIVSSRSAFSEWFTPDGSLILTPLTLAALPRLSRRVMDVIEMHEAWGTQR